LKKGAFPFLQGQFCVNLIAMEERLGQLNAQHEQPPARKFSRPLVLIPDLFATISHLSMLAGYFVSIGWEVYSIDPWHTPNAPKANFDAVVCDVRKAILAVTRGPIVLGHGLGGLIALKLAEDGTAGAGVAFAPPPPGFASPLFASLRNRLAVWAGRSLSPPARRLLFELVADADPFHREAIIKGLRSGPSAAFEITRCGLDLQATSVSPRLIVCGDADIFAPFYRVERLAGELGVELATLKGRGHWLIGGRALERAVGETQRFLVKQLGEELLLLYPKDEG
jgi:pimeloyl-ACP methyl ester carboxylesterase